MVSGINNKLKVLWFTNTPSLYKKNNIGYNGGGWIESLEQIVANENNIELAVSFFHSDECFKTKQNKTTYYPIALYNSKIRKIKHNLFYNKYDYDETNYYLNVVEDFQPDIIHIFGTERSFGLITKFTNIPVVIHLQGILNPNLNAYFAPGSSFLQLIKNDFLSPGLIFQKLKSFSFFNYNVKREVQILSNCSYFMGRTDWDKNISKLYSPKSNYFYCSEVLRDLFYESNPFQFKNNDKLILVSTISKTSYKGFDLILKTAKLLKEQTEIDFEWKVFGIKEYKEWEIFLGIQCSAVNINLMGVADSSNLVKNILEADIFIHPSYIDNSPNSVCEAQLLGIPVISTNVGGIGSLIKDNVSGYLVPSNDPFILASRIIEIRNNPNHANLISDEGRKVAMARHNRETIKNDLLNCYRELRPNK